MKTLNEAREQLEKELSNLERQQPGADSMQLIGAVRQLLGLANMGLLPDVRARLTELKMSSGPDGRTNRIENNYTKR
ncbi:MAG TPA: hypothetical protein PKI35_06845 [Bacteroidales bacterium]|nr:hypothetical protein [Bacteroidales bacterium]